MATNLSGGTIPGFTVAESQEIANLAEVLFKQAMNDPQQSKMKHGAITTAYGMAAKLLAVDAVKRAKKPMPITEAQAIQMAKNTLGNGFDQQVMMFPKTNSPQSYNPNTGP